MFLLKLDPVYKKGAVWMISKNSKTCTIVSLGLLGSCIALGVVPFVIKEQAAWLLLSYYSCCVLSGVSLIFSRGSRSKFLRGFVVIVHFLCVHGLAIFIVLGLFIFEPSGWLIIMVGLCYLFVSTMLFFSSQKKWGKMVIVSLPLLFSLACFIWGNYLLAGHFSFEIIGALILLTYFGLIGLILSAQLEGGKIKWVLLGINYFFATYFHVVLVINEISWL